MNEIVSVDRRKSTNMAPNEPNLESVATLSDCSERNAIIHNSDYTIEDDYDDNNDDDGVAENDLFDDEAEENNSSDSECNSTSNISYTTNNSNRLNDCKHRVGNILKSNGGDDGNSNNSEISMISNILQALVIKDKVWTLNDIIRYTSIVLITLLVLIVIAPTLLCIFILIIIFILMLLSLRSTIAPFMKKLTKSTQKTTKPMKFNIKRPIAKKRQPVCSVNREKLRLLRQSLKNSRELSARSTVSH